MSDLPELLTEWLNNRSDSWDLEKSDKFREEGNLKFNEGNEGRYFAAAIVQYNKALICGRKDKVRTSLCYANRSAAYLELGYFKHCLHNIEMAQENYPREKIQKLHERRQKCLEMMKNSVDKSVNTFVHTFKLSYEPNPKLPFFIDSLELKDDSKYGKHLISTRDLKAGDVIAVIKHPWKDPVNSLIENYPQGCYNCHDTNNCDLIPGDCKALFCSEACKSEHQHQSWYNEEIYELETVSLDRLSSTMKFFLYIHNVFESIDEMKKFVDEHCNKQYTVFDFDLSDVNNPMYYKNVLLTMLNPSEIEPRDDVGKSLELCRAACYLFKKDSQLALILNGDKKNDKFLDKVLHAIENRAKYVLNTGCCGSTFARFFHPSLYLLIPSCKPNIMVHTNRRDIVWTAYQPISAGTPIMADTTIYNPEKDGCFECSSKDEALVPYKKDGSNEETENVFDQPRTHSCCDVFFKQNDPKILTNWLTFFKSLCDFINENFDKYDEDPKMNLAIKEGMAKEINKILSFIENPCQSCNRYIINFNNHLDHLD